ncbi:S8 family serine peptidase, partial [Thermodesulfobacteriota bacterium]
LTGKGIIIADFDTGVDVLHPLFWNADGDRFDWIDVNQNALFDPDQDAVDLNANGQADSGEVLGYIDATIYDNSCYDVKLPGYNPDTDWLFADSDNDGMRDAGSSAGYSENDPVYGEHIFIADDADSSGTVGIGEQLIALKTSKIIATMNSDSVSRSRGEDLIVSEADTVGHGTGVCGILSGGAPFKLRYSGVAPDAELLVANIYRSDQDEIDWTDYMLWARQMGARVMLHEIGSWVFQFLDGSSNMETAIDEFAAEGIVQVVPAGNLGTSDRHARVVTRIGQSRTIPFSIPAFKRRIRFVYGSVLWRSQEDDPTISVSAPVGLPRVLQGDGRYFPLGNGVWIWSDKDISSRGTTKVDFMLLAGIAGFGPLRSGIWQLGIATDVSDNLTVDCYLGDDVTGWTGGVAFTEDAASAGTIDFPATADSAITVASYSTRGLDLEEIGLIAGELSGFSSRGKRIDGMAIMDVAAPGNYDVFSAHSLNYTVYCSETLPGSYAAFGGTSAAGPHVAGAAALLLQAYPEADHEMIADAIREGARSDGFTGTVPNDSYGFGKLDALGALQWLEENY